MPEPPRTSTRPSTSSAISASRTEGRETPSFAARSRSVGSRVPTGNSPALISARNWSAICRYSRRGSMLWIGMGCGCSKRPSGLTNWPNDRRPPVLRQVRDNPRWCSEFQLAQTRMVVGPSPQRPEELALAFLDRQVVDAGVAVRHQAGVVEQPVLVAVAAVPVAAVVVPLVGEAHGDAVALEGPQFLDQAVVELARPLALEQRLRGGAAHGELGAVAPAGVRAVGEHDAAGVARVPRVLGEADLLDRGVAGEGRQRRAGVHGGVLFEWT